MKCKLRKNGISKILLWHASTFKTITTKVMHFCRTSRKVITEHLMHIDGKVWRFMKLGPVPWCSTLSLRVQCRHPTWALVWFRAALLPIQLHTNGLGRQQRMPQNLGICIHTRDPWLWIGPASRFSGSDQQVKDLSSCLSFSFCFNSALQIEGDKSLKDSF